MPDQRFIDPAGLGLVSRMELVARQAVEGFLSGLHPSPYYGSSVEYADHRPYTLGDEWRTIDWKLLAKTDKYYVKLFEEQTNCRCTIVLDASKSMAFKSAGQMSKLEYGSFMAAALAYLMLNQNDAVGLAVFDHQVRHYLPARSTAAHFRNMVAVLEKTTPGAETGIGAVLHELAGRLKQRGIVIVISDLIDDPGAIADGLAHFRFKRHEVIVFHLLDPAETTFPYDRLTRFKDMEGSGTVIANAATVRKKYMQRLHDFLQQIRRACHERDVSYELAQTDTPYAQMLSKYLERRAKMK